MVYVLIYLIGAVLTYVFTVITIRNPNDEDRTYADPPEWDFCHVGASIVFPIFWIIFITENLCHMKNNIEKKVYDKFNKE